MKRMRIMGLCLAAIFAVSAVAAVSASAALPEYKTCYKTVKVAKKYTGSYTDKLCSKAATPTEITEGKKNTYEVGDYTHSLKLTFTGKGKKPINRTINPLEGDKEEGNVLCKAEAVVGTVIGPKETTFKSTWTGCKGGGTPCQSTGAASEEIKGAQQDGTLLYLDAAKTKVGIRVKAAVGNVLAEYECAGGAVKIKATGEVIGEHTGDVNVFSKKNENIFAKGATPAQKYFYEEEQGNELAAWGYLGWGKAYEECIATEMGKGLTFEEAEGACFTPWPDYPYTPAVILSHNTGSYKPGTAPATQEGKTADAGETMKLEA